MRFSQLVMCLWPYLPLCGAQRRRSLSHLCISTLPLLTHPIYLCIDQSECLFMSGQLIRRRSHFKHLLSFWWGLACEGGWGGQETPLIRENTQDLSSGKGIGAWGRPAYCQFYLLLGESRERKLKPSKVIEHLKFISLEKIIAVLTRKNMATHLILQLSHRPKLFLMDSFRTAKAGRNFPLDCVKY